MSWFVESEPTWFHRFCCNVLKAGATPRHVAFIMDGNRRYARQMGLGSVIDGHIAGFDKLSKTLEWCRDLEIREVTVYAFSIENFKRSDHEVNGIMDLAREKFKTLFDEKDKLEEYQVCIRFFGNLELLPRDLQKLIGKISLLTRSYDRYFLNVCIAYTSQDEIARSMNYILKGVEKGFIEPDDIDDHLLSKCLDTGHSPNPELLVRTSGECRFSDFLLWQCSESCLYFDKVLWPDFSFWHLCYGILHFQRNMKVIKSVMSTKSCPLSLPDSTRRTKANHNDDPEDSGRETPSTEGSGIENVDEEINAIHHAQNDSADTAPKYRTDMRTNSLNEDVLCGSRIEEFLEWVDDDKLEYLKNLAGDECLELTAS